MVEHEEKKPYGGPECFQSKEVEEVRTIVNALFTNGRDFRVATLPCGTKVVRTRKAGDLLAAGADHTKIERSK